MFARAREASGLGLDEFDAATVSALASLLTAARARYGPEFAAVLDASRVWINGDEPPDGEDSLLRDGDEVAVLPPVSGG